MNDIRSGLIVWLAAILAFIGTLSIMPVQAEAAPITMSSQHQSMAESSHLAHLYLSSVSGDSLLLV